MAVVGKILLGILILLLILILFILFYPICYRVTGKKNSEGFFCNIRVHWLLGLLRVFYDYPNPGKAVIKIAFLTLGNRQKKSGKKSRKKNAKDKGSPKVTDEPEDSPELTATGTKSDSVEAEINEEPSKEEPKAQETLDKKETSASEDPKPSSEKPKKKQRSKFDLEKLKSDVRFYKELWEDENTKPFLKDALARVFHLLKNLLPRKIKGQVTFGASSPDVTGYVYGGYCMFRALYPKKLLLELTPDFENKILEADFYVKGHFTIFIIICDALRLWFDKRLKRIRKKFDEHKSEKKEKEE